MGKLRARFLKRPTIDNVHLQASGNVYLGDASQSVEAADGVMPIAARNPTSLGGSTIEDTTVASVTTDNMQEAENHGDGETDQ